MTQYTRFFVRRGYPQSLVRKAFHRLLELPRGALLRPRTPDPDLEDTAIFTFPFSQHSPVRTILNDLYATFLSDPFTAAAFPRPQRSSSSVAAASVRSLFTLLSRTLP